MMNQYGGLISDRLLWFVVSALQTPFLFSLSHDGTDSPPEADEVVVVLNNFKSKIIKVKVSLAC